MTIAMGVNIITRQMNQFSQLLFKLCLLIYFISVFQVLQNSSPKDPFSALCSGLYNKDLHVKDDTFKPVNIDTLFLRTSANF